MNKIMSAFQVFVSEDQGITAIEYALMAALLGASIAIVVGALGGNLVTHFTYLGNMIAAALT